MFTKITIHYNIASQDTFTLISNISNDWYPISPMIEYLLRSICALGQRWDDEVDWCQTQLVRCEGGHESEFGGDPVPLPALVKRCCSLNPPNSENSSQGQNTDLRAAPVNTALMTRADDSLEREQRNKSSRIVHLLPLCTGGALCWFLKLCKSRLGFFCTN